MAQISCLNVVLLVLCLATVTFVVLQTFYTRVICSSEIENWLSENSSTKLSQLQVETFSEYDTLETFVVMVGNDGPLVDLVISIIDAHPTMIASLDTLGMEWYSKAFLKLNTEAVPRVTKYKVCHDIRSLSLKQGMFRALGSKFNKDYDYYIPDMWQGTYRDQIKVAGSRISNGNEMMEIMEGLEERIKVPVKFILVVGNPFDDIANIALRLYQGKKEKLTDEKAVTTAVTEYLNALRRFKALQDQLGANGLIIRPDDVAENPRGTILSLCRHLNAICDEDFVAACLKTLTARPLPRARNKVQWTPRLEKKVKDEWKKFSFLGGSTILKSQGNNVDKAQKV